MTAPATPRSLLAGARALAAVAGLWLAAGSAQAQFNMVPAPAAAAPAPSVAESSPDYKRDVARHLYAAYASRIWKGKLKPLLHGVMITETVVGADGGVLEVVVIRPPAAPEIGPWVVQLIKRASPWPAPSRLGPTRVLEIWLVDKSGKFQLDTLTEGQL